ncbi:hypothetical protein [Aromatoleum aromaticum]|uniref:hypothetical protein n=1 Tax=Aromatoleum aromaticum TaxID=551760 RepID=UPI00059FB36F|nr:hypothetical protein [Aromatoleum aromaticum]NMG56245.1 hypothetical protein [Aromatoleum aromaticum]
MNLEKPDQSYLEAAKALNEHDIEQLDSRLRPWRPSGSKLWRLQHVERAALQLQYEAESLAQWRAALARLRANTWQ